jgi:hypothetical protein
VHREASTGREADHAYSVSVETPLLARWRIMA